MVTNIPPEKLSTNDGNEDDNIFLQPTPKNVVITKQKPHQDAPGVKKALSSPTKLNLEGAIDAIAAIPSVASSAYVKTHQKIGSRVFRSALPLEVTQRKHRMISSPKIIQSSFLLKQSYRRRQSIIMS